MVLQSGAMIETRFRSLRFIGMLLRLAAWLLFVLGLLGVFTGAMITTVLGVSLVNAFCWYPACTPLGEPGSSLVLLAAVFVLIVVAFLALLGLGDLLSLLVSIEENTRRTAFLLRMPPVAPPPPVVPLMAMPPAEPEAQMPERVN